MTTAALGVATLAAVLSWLLVGGTLALARRFTVLDHPEDRSSHTQPTPTGGGIGMIVALLGVSVVVGFGATPTGPQVAAFADDWQVVLAALVPLAVVGLWDDVRGVSAGLRLTVHLLCALGLLLVLPPGNFPALVVLAVLLAGSANAYNFMDGSNGMAGAQAVVSGALLAGLFVHGDQPGLALAAAGVAAVALGFLPWNLGRARIFMGDAGSIPLGFAISALCYLGVLAGCLPWPVALAVLAVFWVDAGWTLLGRLRRGERWYTAHRKHVYQRLISQGWSHGQVLLLYMALNLVVVAPVVILGTLRPEWAPGGAVLAFIVLSLCWGIVSLKLGEGP